MSDTYEPGEIRYDEKGEPYYYQPGSRHAALLALINQHTPARRHWLTVKVGIGVSPTTFPLGWQFRIGGAQDLSLDLRLLVADVYVTLDVLPRHWPHRMRRSWVTGFGLYDRRFHVSFMSSRDGQRLRGWHRSWGKP